ncbi:hypothetical protein EYF80_050783 [Liparis tanakae]|uniref:Uncharacterized protein n=1 Tax=Liparis tanakae TaxID=230148 RepID=A0A4Z2FE36_9TELE|nr:hypothetical protein EYF80_050783 [Liparis tanakae]
MEEQTEQREDLDQQDSGLTLRDQRLRDLPGATTEYVLLPLQDVALDELLQQEPDALPDDGAALQRRLQPVSHEHEEQLSAVHLLHALQRLLWDTGGKRGYSSMMAVDFLLSSSSLRAGLEGVGAGGGVAAVSRFTVHGQNKNMK